MKPNTNIYSRVHHILNAETRVFVTGKIIGSKKIGRRCLKWHCDGILVTVSNAIIEIMFFSLEMTARVKTRTIFRLYSKVSFSVWLFFGTWKAIHATMLYIASMDYLKLRATQHFDLLWIFTKHFGIISKERWLTTATTMLTVEKRCRWKLKRKETKHGKKRRNATKRREERQELINMQVIVWRF